MNQHTIDDISTKFLYEGYYWLSDSDAPTVLRGKKLDITVFQQVLPFVVEGHFYAQDGQKEISIQVRYLDGTYQVSIQDLATIPTSHKILRQFLGIQPASEASPLGFQMYEIWDEVSGKATNQLLADMPTLEPQGVAFAGFTK